MAVIAVEKEICGGCGSTVREGSVFCYSCGKEVSPIVAPEPIEPPAPVILARGPEATAKPDNVLGDREPSAEAELRSSSPGRGARAFSRKPAEIVWVERKSSAWGFFLISIGLAVFAGILLALALYLE